MKKSLIVTLITLCFFSTNNISAQSVEMTVDGTQAMELKKNANGDIIISAGDVAGKNLFFGVESGINNTTLGQNTSVGYWTLRDNTTGNANTAMGTFSLTNNSQGINNTAVGWASMQFNTTGNANTAYGFSALRDNTNGYENTAIGLNALENNKSGHSSVALGRRSGIFDTLSVENIYIGSNAGAGGDLTSDKHQKAQNVMIGYNSGQQAQGSSNVFLGYESGKDETGDHKLYIENTDGDSTQALIYGEFDNDIIRLNGKVFMRDGWTDEDCDTKIELEKFADDDKIRMSVGGDEALIVQHSLGDQIIFNMPFNKRNVFLGQSAGFNTGQDSTFVNSGSSNTGVGYQALADNTNGLTNSAFGAHTLSNNITGSGNTAVGERALVSNLSGNFNSAFGAGALVGNTTGFDNVAIGLNAMSNNKTGFYSVAVGRRAGNFDTLSVRNVYLGANAGSGGPTSASQHDKSNNVMIGYGSGENNQGDGNVFLGHQSGEDETGDNKLIIENSNADSDNALIYGDFNSDNLRVNGNMGVGLSQTGAPSDALHIRGEGAQDLFRVQLVGDTKMRIYNNGSIALGSNNTGISAGDVYIPNDLGIGVNQPDHDLHVRANINGNFVAKVENINTGPDAHGLIIQAGDAKPLNTNKLISFNGNGLNEVGSVTGDGSNGVLYNTTSDRRLKDNIQSFKGGIDLLKKIDAHTYEMKANPGVEHIGFIAQELYEVLPNIVKGTPTTTDENNPMMVDYGRMTPVLVAAVKELVEKNAALEKEVAGLKKMNADMAEVKLEMGAQRQLLETLMGALNEKKKQSTMTRK